MQLTNFYHFFVVLFILAQQALSFSIGDYVEINEHNEIPLYGTIVEIKDDNLVTIRPHRFQGDFDIKISAVKIIKTAQTITELKPRANQYSINLMWINKDASNTGSKHIFPDDTTLNKILDTAKLWAQKNPGAEVIIWYDANMLSPTQKNIPEKENVIFKDIRTQNFPEVMTYLDVFSDQTPVFFRVDLLRSVIAYNMLKNHDDRYFFVYADIDVETMDKDQLFDASTIMDLDIYGIIMARGGANGLENSFQIWSNTQIKFLDAAKFSIIDRSIEQKKHISNGNSFEGGTKELDQQVYGNYFFMFPYYYSLQEWCDNNKDTIYKINNLFNVSHLPTCNNPKKEHLYIKTYFEDNGSLDIRKKTYFPSKIINAPRSQFGGTPEKLEPHKLNSLNYQQKLEEVLKNKPFDNYFLQIALQNSYDESLEQIKKSLNNDELAEALLSLDKYENLLLITALNKQQIKLINDILDDINLKELLLKILMKENKVVQKFKRILSNKFIEAIDYGQDSSELLLKIFINNDELEKAFFEMLEDVKKEYVDNIILRIDMATISKNLDLINNYEFMSKFAKSLEKKDEEGNNYFHRIGLKAGISKQKALDINARLQSLFTKYPELLKDALNASNNENKTALQLMKFLHKKNMIENLLNFSMNSVN
jgi:hypothetical protein